MVRAKPSKPLDVELSEFTVDQLFAEPENKRVWSLFKRFLALRSGSWRIFEFGPKNTRYARNPVIHLILSFQSSMESMAFCKFHYLVSLAKEISERLQNSVPDTRY